MAAVSVKWSMEKRPLFPREFCVIHYNFGINGLVLSRLFFSLALNARQAFVWCSFGAIAVPLRNPSVAVQVSANLDEGVVLAAFNVFSFGS